MNQRARQITGRLKENGYYAYLVGGCVRDLLLGREPSDYDVATSARPEQVIELFPGAAVVGAHFGVALVDGVEVATFRSERNYSDGRHPDYVAFETDVRKDVARRDFTINALLMDAESGEVFDYVGGREDLRLGLVRAIGDPDARFREDRLRMLRAVRFAARLGFEIEPETSAAIRRLSGLARDVSAERTRDELVRILTEGAARRGFELLDECGLLPVILPEVAAFKGVAQPPEFHPEGDVWTHVLLMLGAMREPSPALAFGVVLHDVGKPGTFRIAERIRFDGHVELGREISTDILTRLRCSKEEMRRVDDLVANHMRFKDVDKMRESTILRFLRLPHFEEHLELHRLDCLASHGRLDHYEAMKARWERTPPEVLKPPPLLTGDDLLAAGYSPCPAFKQALAAVEDAQLEGRVRSPEEALAVALEVMERTAGPFRFPV